MVLNISSSTILVMFVAFLMPVLLAYKSYFYGRGSYAFLNKSNIECIQGVCLILILFHQVIERVSHPDLILQFLQTLGTGALAVYLFLVGVEFRNFSIQANRLIKKRIFQRAIRLFLMFVSGNVLMGLVQVYLGEEVSLFEILQHTIMGQFLDGSQASLIVTLFVFYLLMGFTQNIKILSLFGWLAGWPGIFVMVGMWVARYQKVVFMILRKHLLNLSLICGILLLLSISWNFLLPIASVLGIMVVLMKVQFKSKVFKLVKQLSVPLYVLQLPLLYLVFYSSEPKDSMFVLVTIGLNLMLILIFRVMLLTEFKSYDKVKYN